MSPSGSVADLTVRELLDDVASREVTPSGGAVAAVGGGAGAALCEMACVHTLAGTDDGDGAGAELREASDDLSDRRTALLALADEDVAAVEDLRAALASTDPVTADPVQRAAERATEVPLETAAGCRAVLESAAVATEAGAPNVVPDAGTGASLAHAGLRAGVWTARSNLPLLAEESVVTDARERADDLETAGGNLIDDVAANVRDRW